MKSSPALLLTLVLLALGLGMTLELAWPALRAAWLLYLVAIVVAGQKGGRTEPAWVVAALASLMALVTVGVSPPPMATAAIVVERGLVLAAIWATAWLTVTLKRQAIQRQRIQQAAEQQIDELAAQLSQADAEFEDAQQALRDAEASYTSLVEHLPVHVVRKDLHGRITFANRTLCELLGRPLEDVLGRTDFDFFPPQLAEKYRQDDFRVMQRREVFRDVEQYQGPDNTLRYMQVMKSPVIDSAGAVVGVQGIFWDVSENKRQEAELRESEVRKRALFEASMDAIILSDHEGKIIEFNRAAEKLFGYTRREVAGQDLVDLILPAVARNRHRDNLLRYAGAGEVGSLLAKRIEVPVRRKCGETFVAEMATQPIPLQGSAAFAIFIRDITKRKEAEAALQQSKEAAEAANRAKSQFVANMSHEIRTPLNAILGMTDLLLSTELSAEQREYLQLLQDSGESLLAVINDVLDFSKIEAGKLDLETAPFDLRERLGDALKSLAFRAHSKGLELVCDVAPEVPSIVLGDAHRLRQVIVNLVGNAIKFTDRGEIVVTVRVQDRKAREVVLECSVCDTGIGIPPDKQKHIFDAFEQADNSMKRRFGGTGLGLAISTRLVKLMGGKIGVKSRVGCGSRFYFTCRFGLPAQQQGTALPPASLENLRVLVVDDNASSRRVLAQMLANWRFQPTQAANGAEAIELVKQAEAAGTPFGLAIVDARMPDGDGLCLISRLQQHTQRELPAIVMVSACNPGDLRQCERLGIAGHLIKPVKQSELFDTIAVVLDAGSLLSMAQPAPATCSLRPLKVLLAEDTLVNQKLAVGLLQRQGHQVVVANNGREALQALESSHFDLVLMDVQMPDMDGLEATEIIRQQEQGSGRRVPIIAMTAHAMKGDRERCLEAGMDGYLAKPIRATALFETMAEVLGESHLSPADDHNGEVSIVDWGTALQAVQHDRDLLRIIVEAFLEEYPLLLQRLRDAVATSSPDSVAAAAHALKGSIRNFGETPPYRAALELETQARAGSTNGAQRHLATIERGLDRLVPELQRFMTTGLVPQPAPTV